MPPVRGPDAWSPAGHRTTRETARFDARAELAHRRGHLLHRRRATPTPLRQVLDEVSRTPALAGSAFAAAGVVAVLWALAEDLPHSANPRADPRAPLGTPGPSRTALGSVHPVAPAPLPSGRWSA